MIKKNPSILVSRDQLNATQKKSIGAGKYTGPRKRDKNEALPPQVDKLEGTYKPDPWPVHGRSGPYIASKGWT